MALKGKTLKPIEERREIVLEALKIRQGLLENSEGKTQAFRELAEKHGISRTAIYGYLEWVTDDPEGRLEEAYEEVDFRLEVLRLLGYEIEERLRQAEEEVEFRREVFKLVRGRANWSRAADRSILPAVETPGLADEPPHHDDHVGEGDPEIFDPIHPLGTPH